MDQKKLHCENVYTTSVIHTFNKSLFKRTVSFSFTSLEKAVINTVWNQKRPKTKRIKLEA